MKRFVKKCRLEIFLFFLCSFIWTGINVTQAFLLEFISDTAVNGITGRIGTIIIWTFSYLILDAVFEFAYSYSVLNARSKISAQFRNALLRRIQRCSIEEKENKGDGYYLAILNDQVDEVESDYITGVFEVICQIFSLIFALAVTTSIQPLMTLVVIVLCVLPLLIPKLFQKRLETTKRDAMAAKSGYLNLLNELMAGFSSLKIFDRSQDVERFHSNANEDTRKKVLCGKTWQRASMSASYGMGNLVVLGAWVFGVIFTLSGSVTVPELIALTSLMNMVAGPFQIISEYYSAMISGRAIAKDLLEFIDSGDKNAGTYKSDAKEVFTVELSHASVIRGDRTILNDVSITANTGEKICIIGSSGSGKSTLLRTMAGILEMQEGNLAVNGQNVGSKPGLTHSELLYLTQDTTLFSASIADNVTLFRKMPEQQVKTAIFKAGLGTWFRSAGEKVGKLLEKSSVNLSGGEQRRFDFARILAEDGKILLFDEPTAGLDTANARNIMEQIATMDRRIIVVATHDLDQENMRRFDEIYMMEAGKIVLHGTPDEVLASTQYRMLKKGAPAT